MCVCVVCVCCVCMILYQLKLFCEIIKEGRLTEYHHVQFQKRLFSSVGLFFLFFCVCVFCCFFFLFFFLGGGGGGVVTEYLFRFI